MLDCCGREINYMRISVTDRCNLRCHYCMPKEGVAWLPMSRILSYEEIEQICRAAVLCGITKFKITGGEPLVRKGCTGLISRLKRLSGVEQVTLTTNGVLLKEYLPELLDAGLDAVNISLDTLDRNCFYEITGSDELERVLASIEAAIGANLNVKINCVLQEGRNLSELDQLVLLAKDRALDVRFIELMPIGCGADGGGVSNDLVLAKIREKYPSLAEDHSVHGNGPAVYYHIPGFEGSIGLISAIHGKFCSRCNRIRLTSTGDLKPCLCYGDSYSLRECLTKNEITAIREKLEEAILAKPQMHCFEQMTDVTELHRMSQLGG